MPVPWSNIDGFSELCFIIGSGPSNDDYPDNFFPELFELGTVVGVNNVAVDFPCHFNVRKSFGEERLVPEELPTFGYRNPDCQLIISEHDCGTISTKELMNTNVSGDYYYFEHKDNLISKRVNWPEGEDEIIVSWSTMTSAMHLAAALGSKLIVLIGHDLGGEELPWLPIRTRPPILEIQQAEHCGQELSRG